MLRASEHFPSPFMYSCQTICKSRDSFINWICGKLFHIFSYETSDSETVLGFGWKLQNSFVHCSPDTISPWHSTLDSSHCSFSSICGQFSYRGIVERHVQCVQMHLVEYAAPSAALSNEVRDQKLLPFAITLTQKLRHIDVIIVKTGFKCCWNEWELVNLKLNAQNLQVAAFIYNISHYWPLRNISLQVYDDINVQRSSCKILQN